MMKNKIIPALESNIIELEKSKSDENSGNSMLGKTPRADIKGQHIKISMSCMFIFVAFLIASTIIFTLYLTTQPKTVKSEFEFANSRTTISNSVLKPVRQKDRLVTCNQMPHRGCPNVDAIWARLEGLP